MKQLSWLHVNQMGGIFFNTGWEAILTVGDLLGRCFKLESVRAMESNVPMGDLFCFFCLDCFLSMVSPLSDHCPRGTVTFMVISLLTCISC